MRSDTAVTEKQIEMEPNLVTVDQTPAADQNNFNNIGGDDDDGFGEWDDNQNTEEQKESKDEANDQNEGSDGFGDWGNDDDNTLGKENQNKDVEEVDDFADFA